MSLGGTGTYSNCRYGHAMSSKVLWPCSEGLPLLCLVFSCWINCYLLQLHNDSS